MVSLTAKKNFVAFTLVEILVVLAILSALLIFAVINIPSLMSRARDAVRKAHHDSMKKSLDVYYEAANCYPVTIPSCGYALEYNSTVIRDSIPCDPESGVSYTYLAEQSACPKSFRLFTNLEYLDDPSIAKVQCSAGCGPGCNYNYGVASSNQNLGSCSDPENLAQQFVCAPGNSSCEVFEDPGLSGCPNIYLDDPTCQNACGDPHNRCHDSSGK
jgi:type II secretory pathway pseudopilin PulG